MADISKIKLPQDPEVYNVKDEYARAAIGNIGKLPTVTSADNGKFLRVVNGAWDKAVVPNAEDNSF